MTSDTGVDTRELPIDDLVALVRERVGSKPVGIEARPNGFSTKLSSYFVTLNLKDGGEMALFVKKVLGETGSRLPDPIDREALVYEALGADPDFAAPDLIGIIGGDDPHLVLDAVPGSDLRYQDLDRWLLVAGELGRMHGAFAPRVGELESFDFLVRHDASYNMATAKLALSVLNESKHTDASNLIEEVVKGYGPVADELARQPATLVHGDLAPKNILNDDRNDSRPVWFVDWEWAGIGPGLGDLADLANGLDRAMTRQMLNEYVAAAGSAVPGGDAAVTRSFELALLDKTMFRLGRSIDWRVSDDVIADWARLASSLHAGLA